MLGSGNRWEKIQIKHRLCPQGTHILLEGTDTHSLTRTQPEDKRHNIERWFCWTTKEGVIYSDGRNIGKLNRKRKHLNRGFKDELEFDKWRRWCIRGRGTSLSEDLELYTAFRDIRMVWFELWFLSPSTILPLLFIIYHNLSHFDPWFSPHRLRAFDLIAEKQKFGSWALMGFSRVP